MINLYQEILEELKEHGKTVKDIWWFGTPTLYFREKGSTLDESLRKLTDFEYDNGYGGNQIVMDFVIVGKQDWWLERHEYDGSEWWEYKEKPKYPKIRVLDCSQQHMIVDKYAIAKIFNSQP